MVSTETRELASLCHFGVFVGGQIRKFKIQKELSIEAVNGVSRGGFLVMKARHQLKMP